MTKTKTTTKTKTNPKTKTNAQHGKADSVEGPDDSIPKSQEHKMMWRTTNSALSDFEVILYN